MDIKLLKKTFSIYGMYRDTNGVIHISEAKYYYTYDHLQGKLTKRFQIAQNCGYLAENEAANLVAFKNTSGRFFIVDGKTGKTYKKYYPTRVEGGALFFHDPLHIISYDWDNGVFITNWKTEVTQILVPGAKFSGLTKKNGKYWYIDGHDNFGIFTYNEQQPAVPNIILHRTQHPNYDKLLGYLDKKEEYIFIRRQKESFFKRLKPRFVAECNGKIVREGDILPPKFFPSSYVNFFNENDFSPDDKLMIYGSNNSIYIIDLDTMKVIDILENVGWIDCIRFIDCRTALAALYDGLYLISI